MMPLSRSLNRGLCWGMIGVVLCLSCNCARFMHAPRIDVITETAEYDPNPPPPKSLEKRILKPLAVGAVVVAAIAWKLAEAALESRRASRSADEWH